MQYKKRSRPTTVGVLIAITAIACSLAAAKFSSDLGWDTVGGVMFWLSIAVGGAAIGYVLRGKEGIEYGVVTAVLLGMLAGVLMPLMLAD